LKDDHFDRLFLLAPIKVSQRIIEVFRSGLGIPLYFLKIFALLAAKNSTVLANPYFPDWRLFGQNPETDLELATMGCTHG
jgi:hypothetical protein